MTKEQALAACRSALVYGRGEQEADEIIAALSQPAEPVKGEEATAHFKRWQELNACDVCGNVPDVEGILEHGKGCYVEESDGGGMTILDDYAPPPAPASQPSEHAKKAAATLMERLRLGHIVDLEDVVQSAIAAATAELQSRLEGHAGTIDRTFALIKDYALKICPDYPGIADCEPSEQLYAIHGSCIGTKLANEDLHKATAELQAKVERLEGDRAKFIALAAAVGECTAEQVPEHVYKAYRQPTGYWDSEVVKLPAEVAQIPRLERELAALKTALEARLPMMAVHSGDLRHNACCAVDSLKEQLAAAEARRIVEGK